MNTPVKPSRPPLGGGITTMLLTCLLGMASYFFGHPSAIELSWFWMALGSLAIVALTLVQYLRARNLQQRDEELAAILDAVPHLVFFKDLDLRYRVLNAEFERIFHTPVREALGRGDAELFSPALQARFEAQDRALMASGEAGAFEERICVEGDLRLLQTRKRPVRDLRGRLYGIVGVAVDVTEQNRVQLQLEEANARLGIALKAARMGFWE
jgi:PAS domain S-box-containing protein